MRDDEVQTGSLGYFGGEISPVASRRARPGGVRHARSGWRRAELDKANRECCKPMPLYSTESRCRLQAGVLARGSQERWLVCRQRRKKKKKKKEVVEGCITNTYKGLPSERLSQSPARGFLLLPHHRVRLHPHLHLPAHRPARHLNHSPPARTPVFATEGLVFRYSQHVFGLAGDKGTRRQGLLLQCPYKGNAMDQAAGDDESGGGAYIDLFIDPPLFFRFFFHSFFFFFFRLFFFFTLFLFSFHFSFTLSSSPLIYPPFPPIFPLVFHPFSRGSPSFSLFSLFFCPLFFPPVPSFCSLVRLLICVAERAPRPRLEGEQSGGRKNILVLSLPPPCLHGVF